MLFSFKKGGKAENHARIHLIEDQLMPVSPSAHAYLPGQKHAQRSALLVEDPVALLIDCPFCAGRMQRIFCCFKKTSGEERRMQQKIYHLSSESCLI